MGRLLFPAAAMLGGLGGKASAHVSDRGFVMLLPTGHYFAGGALAVAASFLALVLLPPDAVERQAERRLTLFTGLAPRGRTAVSLFSFAVFVTLILAGWWGSRDPLSNPLPLTVWTLLWVGLTIVQGVLGNAWSWLNPWYGPYRIVLRLLGRRDGAPFLPLPAAIGYWPAVLLFLAFAWFELIDPAPDDPARLADVATVYFTANLLAMLAFGHANWSRHGECLSAFFSLIARFSVTEWSDKDGRSWFALCLPGAKLNYAAPLTLSGILFLLLTLASVSFDGLSRTFLWLGANGINPLEFPGRTAMTGINTAGLLLSFATLSAVFLATVALGEWLARGKHRLVVAAGLLVWSIVPIALAYHFAHYLTVLLINGQYAMVALSDPFARGWNLFGTAQMQIFTGVTMGPEAARLIWNLQAGAIVLGHMLAVLAAHMMAYRLHPEGRIATISQLPLTLLMMGYTVFGLWLLSTPTGA
ncbi:hypothetical protein MesoLjLc_05060 [Mesorhizobium sp. L-8-10]|nr:hypothetical protein MesoLjLb_05170 [Mesorhizobium sp. L-8-3]BCH28576.1 hypothetical protein MesoLjLc_05060 [Mesorhizobium sp. L-8-10]